MFPFYFNNKELKDIDNWDTSKLQQKFIELERISALAHACIEFPLFTICPPAFEAPVTWGSLTEMYSIPLDIREEMFNEGFHPLSRELYEQKTYFKEPFKEISKDLGSHVIVDCNYGLFFYEFNDRFLRYGLDQAMFNRYRDLLPRNIPFKGQDVLDIGAMRGQLATGDLKNSASEIVEYTVKNRAELLRIINKINNTPKSRSIKLWFRGQPNDYRIKDFSSAKYLTHLPYRNITDSSLVPSLFRLKSLSQHNYKQYYKDIVESQIYIEALSNHLEIKDHIVRKKDDNDEFNLFNSTAWGIYNSGMTSISVAHDGSEIYKKDTYPGFFALQKAFFLQHYGLPSPILDITHSLDIALFFAQNKIVDSHYQRVSCAERPVLYLMLLDEKFDLFMASSDICRDHELLRPLRQKCGFIAGASILNRNYYSRFISVKIYLDEFIEYSPNITPDYLFPSEEEDLFLKKLNDTKEKFDLKNIFPFELKR